MNIETLILIGLPIFWSLTFLVWINFINHSWGWYNKMYGEWTAIWNKGGNINGKSNKS